MTTVSTLPPAPSRNSPSDFAAKADAWVAAIDNWTTEVNTVAGEVNTNATNAATAASTATTKAGEALVSANNAATSESTATTQAGIATTKASEASTSATAALNAKNAAEAALDSFDDRNLGAKSSDPTVDNDGNPLTLGTEYFNTTLNAKKVYGNSGWFIPNVDGQDLQSTATGKGAALVGFKQTGTGSVNRTVDVKLKEFVSVKDFGAVGDGVTDDAVAIQATLDSGALYIFFPIGTYLVSTALRINADGTFLFGSGPLSKIKLADGVQRSNVIESVGHNGIVIENLSVIHNADRGGYFSRHAPSAALTANSGLLVNGTVVIGGSSISLDATTVSGSVNPGDTFVVTGDATVYTVSNSVTAVGNQLNGITFTPALVAQATNDVVVSLYQYPRYKSKSSYATGSSTITLDCAVITPNSAPYPATTIRIGEQFQFMRRVAGSLNGYEVDPANATVYTVIGSDVPITTAGIGNEFRNIQISPALTAPVSANQYITSIQDANNRYSNGIYLGNASDCAVRNVEVYGTPMHGIIAGTGPIVAVGATAGGSNIEITGCRIEYFGGNAIAAAKTTGVRVTNNRIKNNYTSVGQGVQFDDGCDGSTISGNVISDTQYGIMSYAADDLSISNNAITGFLIGILTDATATNISISNNTISGDSKAARGVMLRKGNVAGGLVWSNISVVGNTIRNILAAGGYGIYLAQEGVVPTATNADDTSSITVANNAIYKTTSNGINLIDTRGCAITGNSVFLAGGFGIYLENTQLMSITGNLVRNSGSSGMYVKESERITFSGNISEKIPFSTSTMTYGLEFGANVTEYNIDFSNRFVGSGIGFNNVSVPFQRMLYATAALDFPSVATKASADLTATVSGAEPGDGVLVVVPGSGTGGMIFTGFVSGTNTVTVRAFNPAAVSVDAGVLTFGLIVFKIE